MSIQNKNSDLLSNSIAMFYLLRGLILMFLPYQVEGETAYVEIVSNQDAINQLNVILISRCLILGIVLLGAVFYGNCSILKFAHFICILFDCSFFVMSLYYNNISLDLYLSLISLVFQIYIVRRKLVSLN